MIYHVSLHFDNGAGVWIATSNDIRGLVMEADTIESLKHRVHAAVPELLELNHQELASEVVIYVV